MIPEQIPSFDPEKPVVPDQHYDFENTTVDGKLYNVDILEKFAESIEPAETPLTELQSAVAEGNYYWLDANDEKLGPHQILQKWEAAQQNPAWVEHIVNIKQADLSNPIWIAPNGMVCNGMHRLTRAFVEGAKSIKVRKFSALPEEAIVPDYQPKKN